MESASVIEFLPLKETRILLDLGFNEPYLGGFCHDINGSMGPYKILYQTALRWFREKHNIHIEIYCNHSGWGYILTKTNGTTIKEITDSCFFATHDEAVMKGIEVAIKLITK